MTIGSPQPISLFVLMIKTIFWNARGAGNARFNAVVFDLVKLNNVDILAICEPKVQFSKASDTLLKLGFNEFKIIEACGFSGGLWLLWNNTKFSVDLVDAAFQAIYLKISIPGVSPWILTVLYASPNVSLRNNLWGYLDNLFSRHNLPWILIGDYNELISTADKSTGSLSGRFGGLKRWVDRNALIDLGFKGSCFTWTNNRIKERLDRGFCNSDWRTLFPDAFIQHLPRIASDHCPILLQQHSNNYVNRGNQPFRFQAMWLSHPDFSKFITDLWNSVAGNFLNKTLPLAHELKQWNTNVFGNIFHKKKRLLARISGIQKARDLHENPFLIRLEETLIKEYETIIAQENTFWRQKSRDKWLHDSEKNTKFFHLTTLVRRKKKRLKGYLILKANGLMIVRI